MQQGIKRLTLLTKEEFCELRRIVIDIPTLSRNQPGGEGARYYMKLSSSERPRLAIHVLFIQ